MKRKNNLKTTAMLALMSVGLAGCSTGTTENQKPTPTPTPISNPPSPTPNPNPDPTPTPTTPSTYKNGTYSATGSYIAPSGPEHVGVQLTLSNGIVTDASVQIEANSPTSQRFQTMFASGYKTYVIGKNIDSLQLTEVSGSSLTPIGFNDAVSQIKVQAQS